MMHRAPQLGLAEVPPPPAPPGPPPPQLDKRELLVANCAALGFLNPTPRPYFQRGAVGEVITTATTTMMHRHHHHHAPGPPAWLGRRPPLTPPPTQGPTLTNVSCSLQMVPHSSFVLVQNSQATWRAGRGEEEERRPGGGESGGGRGGGREGGRGGGRGDPYDMTRW